MSAGEADSPPRDPLQLASCSLRLRPDASIEPLPVTERFWPDLMSGRLGSFHNEYLVTMHHYSSAWPQWERHPHGDEIVLLLSGAMDVFLEEPAGRRAVALREPGDFVRVPKGQWHTATPRAPSTVLFLTAGEGTQHRPVEPPR